MPPSSERPRVLIAGPTPPPLHGVATFTQMLLESTLKERYRIVHLDTGNPRSKALGRWSFMAALLSLAHAARLLWCLVRYWPAIVYVPVSQNTLAYCRDAILMALALAFRRRLVVHIHGGYFGTFYAQASRPMRWLIRATMGRARKVVVLGECLRGIVATILPPDRVAVVANGVPDTFLPAGRDSAKKAGATVAYLGTMFFAKGVMDLLMAAAVIRKQGRYDVRFRLAGSWLVNNERSQFLAMLEAEGMANVVELSAPVHGDAKQQFLAGADIFAFPPRAPEGQSLVILEAMAAGLPVISTDQGAIRETVIDGQTGLIVDKQNPEQLAAAILKLADDPELRRRMGAAGRQRFEQEYTIERCVDRLAVVFNAVLAKPGTGDVRDVHDFWNREACGSHFIKDADDRRDFYARYREFRYRTEWHIPLLVPFAEARGKRLLDIGCGNGADGVMFAANGADYVGVDLTPTAVEATREHFEVAGLKGLFHTENAEHLSFADNTFDMVYSHGVLHHSPSPAKTINEAYRVLKPGGTTIIMLYHKHSFNYYVRIMGYMRLRVLMKLASRLGCWGSDRAKLARPAAGAGPRDNQDRQVWNVHYHAFLTQGWHYLCARNFVHHCTDGPECPYAYVFTKRDVQQLFSAFKDVGTKVAHFPLRKYRWGRWIPLPFEKFLASKIGFSLFIRAVK